ncbi:MAG: protein-glutamate methylesterase/protein-glutamine glutaminase [Opitutales bacterium]
MDSGPIRVMVVDDSPTIRKLLKKIFESDDEIDLVASAMDPFEARDKIKQHKPDVLVLDLELPKMDGLTFLKIIMKQRPMPVIIFSTLSKSGTAIALEALRSGAFDVFGKPESSKDLKSISETLCMKVKEAGWALRHKTWRHRVESNMTASPFSIHRGAQSSRIPWPEKPQIRSNHLLLVGASTGGTEAVSKMLRKLPPQFPPILVTQHIPKNFSHSFALRLEAECALTAKEAEHGEEAKAGCIYVAPGGKHMTAKWTGRHYQLSLNEDEPVWHQRPAVDILFKSLVESAGPHMVATILTGMGRDGADGLKALRDAGVRCFAQNEESCVVFGMPRAAEELGAPEKMLHLKELPDAIIQAFQDSFKGKKPPPPFLQKSSADSTLTQPNASLASQRFTRPPVSRNIAD